MCINLIKNYMTKNAIIWFRNDLRLYDNNALDYAYRNNYSVIFLYILDNTNNIGETSKWFLYKALLSLKNDIKIKYNTELIIKNGETKNILNSIIKKYNVESILYNKVYEPDILVQDKFLTEELIKQNIKTKSFNSSLLFEPSEIKNISGGCFKVFTPFWKKCLSIIDNIKPPVDYPNHIQTVLVKETNNFDQNVFISNTVIENSQENNWNSLYNVSEKSAYEILQNFMKHKITEYKNKRDYPSKNNTSILSPFLHFGLISPKTIYFNTKKLETNIGIQHFISEIGWREFAYHLLYNFNNLSEENFNIKFNNFPWENNIEYLEKWQQGKTGVLLVDAGMRQLKKTGWMHNRVRMVTASFLTKNLLIDWRLGQKWFWQHLIDADLAINSASWQWVAGSGADAAPYFRIFNPILQSKKFDPDAEYIKRWIPEISHLSIQNIYSDNLHNNYIKPIVELSTSRNKALNIYNDIK